MKIVRPMVDALSFLSVEAVPRRNLRRNLFVSMTLLSIVACRSARESSVGSTDGGRDIALGNATGTGGAGHAIGDAGAGPMDGTIAIMISSDAAAPDSTIDAVGCVSGQKVCGGTCVSIDDPKYGCDPTLCDGTVCPSVPGATLICQAGLCVVGACGAGTKKCGSACVSETDPAYGCGATTCDASNCPSPGTGGSVICQGGACVIGTCGAGLKKCDARCVAISDPTYGCGALTCSATGCPTSGTGTLVCQGDACVVGTCGAGTKNCANKCVPIDSNNGCGDTTRCTACANNEACMGSPTSACTCVPTDVAAACAGKCGQVANGCGGLHTCGTCTTPQTCSAANVCTCTPVAMATACAGRSCGTADNGCGGTYTCGTCTAPQICNTATGVCGCTPVAMATACAGKSCGTAANGCGGTYTCGTCTAPQICNTTTGVCGCTPDATATTCMGKACGPATNNCGSAVSCPDTCKLPNTCNAGTAGVNDCGCSPTAMATVCAGKCGTLPNGCGNYTCTCPTGQTCTTAGACCTPVPMTTACAGKCGSASNGCGGTYTCTCPTGQTCTTAGTCCTTTLMATACNGKECGSVADGCGGMINCNKSCSANPSGGAYSCTSNMCVLSCTTGTNCSGACIDTKTDANHCGSCTMSCASPGNGTAACVASACLPTCNDGQPACGGKCCPSPPPNFRACNNSLCSPAIIHPIACGGGQVVGSWSFESNSTEGFLRETNALSVPGSALTVSSAHPRGTSKYALKSTVNFPFGDGGNFQAYFQVTPCPSSFNLQGRKISAWVFLEGSGSGSGSVAGIASNGTVSAGAAFSTAYTAISSGMFNQWVQLTLAFDASDTDVSTVNTLGLDVETTGATIYTVYVDDVVVDPPL